MRFGQVGRVGDTKQMMREKEFQGTCKNEGDGRRKVHREEVKRC